MANTGLDGFCHEYWYYSFTFEFERLKILQIISKLLLHIKKVQHKHKLNEYVVGCVRLFERANDII